MKTFKFLSKIIFLFFIVAPMVGCFIVSSSKKAYNDGIKHMPYDAIIVPGYPFDGEKWHDVMKARVYWSHYLYSNQIAKNVIYSGSAVYSPYTEARIMALYGEALGIPTENILIEPKAQHSTENLYYSYQLAKAQGFENIALATDPFQSKMLRTFAKKHLPGLKFLPINFDTLAEIEKTDPGINPAEALVEGFVSLKERQNFFQRLKGTMGHEIEYEGN